MKHLTQLEIERLRALIAYCMPSDTRNAVMLLTALECGLRAQELLNLTLQDLNFEDRTIRVKTLKRGMPRTIPAPRALFEWVSSRACEPASKNAATVQPMRLFGIGYQRLVQIWGQYRPSPKNFHALRHTFALGLYHRRKDINLVKHCLGHKSLSSTTVYLEETYNQDTLRKAMGIK